MSIQKTLVPVALMAVVLLLFAGTGSTHAVCPVEGQVFSTCARPCTFTCDNVKTLGCATVCTTGCDCPGGQVIDTESNKCVPVEECPSKRELSCPSKRRGYGICAITCLDDSECRGRKKCCPTACGGTTCTRPVRRKRPQKPDCKNVACITVACPNPIYPEGACCPLCPKTEGEVCEYNGQTYQPGDSFLSADGCNKCRCIFTGDVICTRRACPSKLVCPKPTGAGACEEFCSSDEECGPGQKCCSNGCGHACTDAIDCSTVACPQVFCLRPEFPEGECCPVCKEAKTARTFTRPPISGICAELCSSDDDCGAGQTCTSNGCGHVCVKARDCSDVVCPAVYCPNPVFPGVTCCPLCPRDGSKAAGTGTRPPIFGICTELCSSDDDCGAGQKCTSNGCGHVCIKARNCSDVVCPAVYCPDPVFPGVTCCPVCPREESEVCEYNGQTYQPGDSFTSADGCNTCHCIFTGDVICRKKACPSKSVCPKPTGVGACSEYCSSDEECGPGQKCCSNGCGHACTDAIDCSAVACPQVFCPRPEFLEGECCPVCKKPKPAGTGTRPPMSGKCAELCSCDGDCGAGEKCTYNGCGHVCMKARDCSEVACLDVECPNPVYPKGACCPLCPATKVCEYNGQTYQPGDSFTSTDGCNPCRCIFTGDVLCRKKACPSKLICPKPTGVGQCTEFCSSDEECGSGQKCCSNGCGHACADAIDCSDVACALVYCPRPVYLEGKCCPVCPT